MEYMFHSSFAFNQPIGQWDVSQVTNMQYMFQSAPAFAQSLESWPETTSTLCDELVRTNNEMFNGATAFRSKFSCPSGNFGPPVKCICNNMHAAFLIQISEKEWHMFVSEAPVDGNCYYYGPLYQFWPLIRLGRFASD